MGGGADYAHNIITPQPHEFFRPSYGPEREWQAYDEDVLKGLWFLRFFIIYDASNTRLQSKQQPLSN